MTKKIEVSARRYGKSQAARLMKEAVLDSGGRVLDGRTMTIWRRVRRGGRKLDVVETAKSQSTVVFG